jgi:diguanylate cyclase (GGDEF)-like protein
VGVAIQKAQLFETVQHLAITDPLTGLFNRRYFFERATQEFDRALRYRRPLGILIWDTDHFKQVNDTYGHLVGDQVLRTLAERCRISLREADVLGRYGGEEFVALLPETGMHSAYQAGERLRQAVSRTPIRVGVHEIPLSISVGVASLAEGCPSLEALLGWADQALLNAKAAGRDRVMAWQGPEVSGSAAGGSSQYGEIPKSRN